MIPIAFFSVIASTMFAVLAASGWAFSGDWLRAGMGAAIAAVEIGALFYWCAFGKI